MHTIRFAALSVLFLSLSACVSNPNTLALGTLGALGGALGGNQIGSGKGTRAAIAAGTLLGGVAGSFFGNKLDTINSNQRNINALANQPSSNAAPIVYQIPTAHHPQHSYPNHSYQQRHSIPLSCSISNNYVVCNGN